MALIRCVYECVYRSEGVSIALMIRLAVEIVGITTLIGVTCDPISEYWINYYFNLFKECYL